MKFPGIRLISTVPAGLSDVALVAGTGGRTVEAPKNKKRNLEMANRHNLAEFHDELRDLLIPQLICSAQKLNHPFPELFP
jgi:hypothetical protein